jgi:hypothetical protein
MTELSLLWLPIVVSAVAVFVTSSILHMGPLWHRKDYPPVPSQDRVMEALRPFAIPPGDYMMPRAQGSAEMRSPEFAEKVNRGPVAILTVMPSGPWGGRMRKQLGAWFLYLLAVGFFSAYVASRALPPAADYTQVFRFAGTAAFLSHAVGLWPVSIWYQRGWDLTLKGTLDGLIYALITAGIFGTFWPS